MLGLGRGVGVGVPAGSVVPTGATAEGDGAAGGSGGDARSKVAPTSRMINPGKKSNLRIAAVVREERSGWGG